jgi:hypothetical protein
VIYFPDVEKVLSDDKTRSCKVMIVENFEKNIQSAFNKSKEILKIADSKKTKVNLSENGDVVRQDKDTYL